MELGRRSLAGLASALLLLASAAFQGCGGGGENARTMEVELALEPDPPTTGETLLRMALRDAAGEPLSGARVRVEANMNHAGMVPEFADATEVEHGRYEATITFTMGGDWYLVVGAETSDGQRMEEVIALPGVSAERAVESER